MRINIKLITAALIVCSMTLTACGGNSNVTYTDGTYTAQSTVFESEDGTEYGNGYGEVSITIKDGAISECTFKTYEPDGTLKGEDYGKERGEIANKDFYKKAQNAVAACDEYASQLVANGGLDGIDSISGASINYSQFQESVRNALDQAVAK